MFSEKLNRFSDACHIPSSQEKAKKQGGNVKSHKLYVMCLMWLSHDLQFTSVHPSATSSTECIAEAIAM